MKDYIYFNDEGLLVFPRSDNHALEPLDLVHVEVGAITTRVSASTTRVSASTMRVGASTTRVGATTTIAGVLLTS